MAKKSTLSMPMKEEDNWRTENDMRTIMESETIKSDAKRYAKVKALAKRKMMEVAKIAAESEE